jgi:hypothetical protein
MYDESEPLHRRALAIWEQQLGPTHPDVATGLNNLASVLVHQVSDRLRLWFAGDGMWSVI